MHILAILKKSNLKQYFVSAYSQWRQFPRLNRIAIVAIFIAVFILIIIPTQNSLPQPLENKIITEAVVIPDLPRQEISVTPIAQDKIADPITISVKKPQENIIPLEPVNKPQTVVTTKKVVTHSLAKNELNKWQSLKINKGDTLSKIFRSHNLPIKDLYSIVDVEGNGKPLSKIQAGQSIKYKQKNSAELDALEINLENGHTIMYIRLSDGSFMRDHN